MIDSSFSADILLTAGQLWWLFLPIYAFLLWLVAGEKVTAFVRSRVGKRSARPEAGEIQPVEQSAEDLVRQLLADHQSALVADLASEVRGMLAPLAAQLEAVELRSNRIVLDHHDIKAQLLDINEALDRLHKAYHGTRRRTPTNGM